MAHYKTSWYGVSVLGSLPLWYVPRFLCVIPLDILPNIGWIPDWHVLSTDVGWAENHVKQDFSTWLPYVQKNPFYAQATPSQPRRKKNTALMPCTYCMRTLSPPRYARLCYVTIIIFVLHEPLFFFLASPEFFDIDTPKERLLQTQIRPEQTTVPPPK